MKLNYKKIFYVGLAFLLVSMFWQTYDSIITKILIDKFGLNQTWSGLVMALDNILALFLIPLFGSLSDKANTKRGRRTPFIIVGTVIAAFAFMALTFSDNVQKSKINTQSEIINNYNTIYESDEDLSYSEWNSIYLQVESEWLELKNNEIISIEKYNEYENDIILPMEEILEDDIVSDEEVNELKILFDLHANKRAWVVTSRSPSTFIVFVVTLLIALLSMATFRSPAVALMPDVTIKPLRSKANAIINLMGSFGALISLGILMIFGLDRLSYVDYTPAFIAVGIMMIVLLIIFLIKVKEPELVAEKVAKEVKYNLEIDEVEIEEVKPEKLPEEKLSKEKRLSLILILVSVSLWFMGYNAVTTKLSDYAPKVLEIGYGIPIYIAHGAALIAFVPIGIIATKIGRRKIILMGIVLLTLCFGSVYFLTKDTAFLMYLIFGLTGIGWATINVNSYPMVVELAKGSNVGKYTGYYYTFSMGAQIITPIFSGFLMDQFGRIALFPYATVFVAMAFVTMFLVKHGDAKIEKKGSLIENFDVDMD